MRRALLTSLVLLAGCGFEVAGTSPSGDGGADAIDTPSTTPWLPGFTKRKPIDLGPASSALTDFVASIAEDADADLVNAQTLVFTAADGTTVLPTEIVVFDSPTGEFEAAVGTGLAAGKKTRIYLYYGDGPQMMSPSPWGPLYAGVWHMGGAGPNRDVVRDSKLLHDAAGNLTEIPAVVPGQLGDARLYDGTNDTLSVPDPPDGSLDFGMTSFTVGIWVKVDQSKGSFDMPLFKGGSSSFSAGYDFELGTGNWIAGFSDAAAMEITPRFGAEIDLLHEWHYLVSQCDRSTSKVRTFLDGTVVEELAFPRGSLSSDFDLQIGDRFQEFNGLLDEVKIYTAAISPDWIAMEYANMMKRSQFQTVGPAELRQ